MTFTISGEFIDLIFLHELFFNARFDEFLAANNKSYSINVLVVLGTWLKVSILPFLTILIFFKVCFYGISL